MRQMKLQDVFKPFGVPTVTYVGRPELEAKVDRTLVQEGQGLLIYGPSATGKTTLVKKRLSTAGVEDYVELMPSSTEEFSKAKLTREIATRLALMRGIGNSSTTLSDARLIELETKILEIVSRDPRPIVVEDARRAHVPVLADFAKSVNQWSDRVKDPSFMLVVIGIDIDIEQFLACRPQESIRLQPVPVDRFTGDQIVRIMTAGESALNIEFSEDLRDLVLDLSAGLPQVCQDICYDICAHSNIDSTHSGATFRIDSDSFFPAVEMYANRILPQFRSRLDQAQGFESSKGTRASDVLKALFEAQEAAGDVVGTKPVEITVLVEYLRHAYRGIEESEVEELVKKLSSPAGGEILVLASKKQVLFREPIFRFLYRARTTAKGRIDRTDLIALREALVKAIRPSGA